MRFCRTIAILAVVAAVETSALWPAPAQAQDAPPPPPMSVAVPPAPTPVTSETLAPTDVLTRGPVHEAFAELVSLNPEPGIVVSLPPPAPIAEVPPDTRPADMNAAWIPGYWAFDDERGSFIWISGIWRDPPPECSWVPGYWAETAAGWQWTSGFWLPGGEQVVYHPAPPATQEAGPIGDSPSDNDLWVPGCWMWQDNQYLWRPGFWSAGQANWIWMPRHFVWTPRGYILIEGHWDYPLERRGMLFAPVAFATPVYTQPGFEYSPTVVILTDQLDADLFARPQYSHYYFGDYYDAGYARSGIFPWYAYREQHTWYDSAYDHDRWQHRRDDPQWDAHQRQVYAQRTAEPAARPPRTLAALQTEIKDHPERVKQFGAMAQPLHEVVANKASPMKFEKIAPQTREQLGTHVTNVHAYRQQRAQWEGPAAPAVGKAGPEIATPPAKGTPETVRPTPPAKTVPEVVHPTPPAKGGPEGVVPSSKGVPEVIHPTPPAKGGPVIVTPPAKGGPETTKPVESRKPIVEPETVKIPPSPVRAKPVPPPHPVAPTVVTPKAEAPRAEEPKTVAPRAEPTPPRAEPTPPRAEPTPPAKGDSKAGPR
jgi:hypothetical protein